MDIQSLSHFVEHFNNCLAVPSTFIFLGVGVFLSCFTRFVQIRALPMFFRLISQGSQPERSGEKTKSISSIGALFTAMATTIGMGNIVMPSIAIAVGGPGALFWLVFYSFFGCVIKFTEVSFALYTRKRTDEGQILGGPTQYLEWVFKGLGSWYGFITVFLLSGWSALQTNSLAEILYQENIPHWQTGLVTSIILFVVLYGGAERVSKVASKVVPLMFVLYVSFSVIILFKDPVALLAAIKLVFHNIFTPAAAVGGFVGASVVQAMRWGTYRSIYITECGVGTTAIPHALADVEYPTDQGVLAMYSVAADMFLAIISGLIVLVTGVWTQGELSSTMIYRAFKLHAPLYGDIILIASIGLFVMTTIIGNSFNGGQSFASFTQYRGIRIYYFFAAVLAFLGSISHVKLIIDITDIILVFVAIPNVLGVAYLAVRYPRVLNIWRNRVRTDTQDDQQQ